MKLHFSRLLLALSLSTCLSQPAWALFDVQALFGTRKTEFKGSDSSTDATGDEFKLAAHLDPIPLVPIGFGLSFAQVSYDDFGAYEELSGTEIGLEVQAWFPLDLFGLVPYAKVGYTVAGAYEAKLASGGIFPDGTDPKAVFNASGLYLAAGIRWEFLLRMGLVLEIEKSTRELKFDKFTGLGGIDVAKYDLDADSTSILLGFQAGI